MSEFSVELEADLVTAARLAKMRGQDPDAVGYQVLAAGARMVMAQGQELPQVLATLAMAVCERSGTNAAWAAEEARKIVARK